MGSCSELDVNAPGCSALLVDGAGSATQSGCVVWCLNQGNCCAVLGAGLTLFASGSSSFKDSHRPVMWRGDRMGEQEDCSMTSFRIGDAVCVQDQGSRASLLRCSFERNSGHIMVTGGAKVTLVNCSANNPGMLRG